MITITQPWCLCGDVHHGPLFTWIDSRSAGMFLRLLIVSNWSFFKYWLMNYSRTMTAFSEFFSSSELQGSPLSPFFLVKQGLLPRNCMWIALLEKHHWAGNYLYTDVLLTAGWAGVETIPGSLSHILQLPIVVFTTLQLAEVISLSILLQRGTEHVGWRVIYWAEVYKLAGGFQQEPSGR